MSDYYCPECNGPRTWDWIFDHVRNACWIGDRDDAAHYADVERLEWSYGGFTRLATEAEIALAEHVSGHSVTPEAQYRNPLDPPEKASGPMTVVTRVSPGCARRVIAGVSAPDSTQEESEQEQ